MTKVPYADTVNLLSSITDPVLLDTLSSFHEAIKAMSAAEDPADARAHFDATWKACSISRSIRLHLGLLANAEPIDAEAVVCLYSDLIALPNREDWYSGEELEKYRACRRNIEDRLTLLHTTQSLESNVKHSAKAH